MKKIIIFSILIFLLSLIARTGSYLQVLQPEFTSYQYYQGMGSGSDADYQVKNAIIVLTKNGQAETLTHYDYIFLIPLITFFLRMFGYIQGLEYAMYFTILLGALTPVMLFFLLAKRTPYLVGSLFVGLALAVNPLLVSVTAGRFILDTLVQCIFAFFVVCYLQALEKKSLFWLIALGIVALIQGLNKPFLMVNDLALLFIFPLFILLKEITYKKTFPFISLKWQITKKLFFYSLIPTLIYVVGNIAWEVILQLTIDRGYFLSDIFFSKASDSSSNFALRDSLVLAKTPLEKLRNITMYSLMATQQLITYMNISVIFFISLIALAILSRKDKAIAFRRTGIISLVLILFFFAITKLFFIPGVTATGVPQTWDFGTFTTFTIVAVLLFFFTQRSITLLAMTAMQLPYLIAVGLTLTTAIYPRHYITLVIWLMMCMGLMLDSYAPKILSKVSPLMNKIVIVGIILMFSPLILQSLSSFQTNVTKNMNDSRYLTWAGSHIPGDGYVLSGSGENLIQLAKSTNKKIVYNSLHSPLIATYSDSVHNIVDFGSSKGRPMEFTKFLPTYAERKKLYITDLNASGWKVLLSSEGDVEFPKDRYRLEAAATDPTTQRVLYRLVLNNN